MADFFQYDQGTLIAGAVDLSGSQSIVSINGPRPSVFSMKGLYQILTFSTSVDIHGLKGDTLLDGVTLIANAATIDRSIDVQWSRTLSNQTYGYVFGEHIQAHTISGIAILTGGGGCVHALNQFFARNNMYTNPNSPSQICIGNGCCFSAYLHSLKVNLPSNSTMLGDFTLSYSSFSKVNPWWIGSTKIDNNG